MNFRKLILIGLIFSLYSLTENSNAELVTPIPIAGFDLTKQRPSSFSAGEFFNGSISDIELYEDTRFKLTK